MKRPLTLLAMAIAGYSRAQTRPLSTHIPKYLPETERQRIASNFGPDAILRNQTLRHANKTTTNFYRLTGWSRYNLLTSAFVDSSVLRYSGQRASSFADESQNMIGGRAWAYSRPDYAVSGRDGNGTDRIENENKYNAAGLETETIFRSSTYTGKSTSTYNAAGQETVTLEFDSSNGGWMANRRYTTTYNAAGRRTSMHIVDLPGSTPVGIVDYFYDAAGNEDTVRSRSWTGLSYEVDYMEVNTWNAANEKRSTTHYYLDDNFNLVPDERVDYTYDASSRLVSSTVQGYINGAWVNDMKDSFAYTGSKPLYTFKRTALWNTGTSTWQGLREWSYTLNAQNLRSIETFKTPGAGGGLEQQTKTEFTYNSTGLITKMETFEYDRTQTQYLASPQERELFHYDLNAPASVKNQGSDTQIGAWPNPVSTVLNIDAGAARIQAIEIISATGTRVLSQNTDAKRADVSTLPPGLYFLRVRISSAPSPIPVRFVKL